VKINKEYTLLAEAVAKVANMAFKNEENDLGELLTLVYACHLIGMEKPLLDMIKDYQELDEWGEY
jgi:hypothetical protein